MIRLELKRVREDGIFYIYNIDDRYKIRFSQCSDNGKSSKRRNCKGCIFAVGVTSLDGDAIPLSVYEEIGSYQGYPNVFAINWLPPTVTLDNFEVIQQKYRFAYDYLRIIKDILYSSEGEHWQLFASRATLKD